MCCCITGGFVVKLDKIKVGKKYRIKIQGTIKPYSVNALIVENNQLAKEYKKPIIASHSDSYSVCKHSRNLTDEDFKDIVSLGGIVGISLCPPHLASDGKANLSDIIKHIEHYLSLGGENAVCMGCDLDGTDLPHGINDISDLCKIEAELKRLGYPDDIIEKIFYKNAFEFIKKNI